MNCQEVETVITDLARNSALEVDARGGALAHLEQCPRCSELLVEQKGLTEGLLAWGDAVAHEQAPPLLEEKLRAAFRRKAIPTPRRVWMKIAAAGAIAAGALLFKLLAPAYRVTPPAPLAAQPPARVVVAQSGAADSPAPLVKRGRQAARPSRKPLPAPPQLEVGTEFLAVPQGDGWTPLDGGRLVRVSLPRSAMGVFGLPVIEGRGPERVQADVMLSDDGALRAIRFVR